MPTLVKPTSDESRLNLLKTSVSTGRSDIESGNQHLSEETITMVETEAIAFDASLKIEAGTLSKREKEVREKNVAKARLETYIRDLWEVTKRRVYRNGEPAEVLTFYQLPLDGTVPGGINENEILALATKIVEGDKKAIAAGYPAAVCPSAAEISAVRDATEKEMADVAPADRQFDEAAKALTPHRALANELINDIIAELEFNLRKLEPSHRRRIMRTYGITFRYNPGEPEDEPGVPGT